MPEFMTITGPECPLCKGTCWTYQFRRYGVAICGTTSCDYSEGPLRFDADGEVLPVPKSDAEAEALHRAFQEVSPE